MESDFPVEEINVYGDVSATRFLPKTQSRSNESMLSVVEPQRELPWTKMDRYGVYGEKSAINSKNANVVSKIINSYLNGIVIHLDETFVNIHRELSELIIDGRMADRDIVDGHIDVSVYLHSVLKPSLQLIIDGNVLEMRGMYNKIIGDGFMKI